MDWKGYITAAQMLSLKNSLLVVRTADNVLDVENWRIDILQIKDGVVVKQTSVHEGCYLLVDMKGWGLAELQDWLFQDNTGQHPEVYHEMAIVETFQK